MLGKNHGQWSEQFQKFGVAVPLTERDNSFIEGVKLAPRSGYPHT